MSQCAALISYRPRLPVIRRLCCSRILSPGRRRRRFLTHQSKKEKNTMTGRRKFTFLMAGTAVIIVALFSAQPNAGAAPDNQHLTGSWLLTVNLTNPPPGVTFLSYKTLMTFTADGSVLETSLLPGTASAGHGHGASERSAKGELAVSAIALGTTGGQPVSPSK